MANYKWHQHMLAAIVVAALASAFPLATVWGFALFGDKEFATSFKAILNYFTAMGFSNPRFNLAMELSFCLVVVLCILSLMEIYKDRRALHGDARFATNSEVQEAGLLGKKGIILGKFKGKYLVFDGQQFVMLAAPTRSGKGVGCVIPNLLNWQDSVVMLDMKLENWQLTSGYRHKTLAQKTYLFNPFALDRKTHRWNPLDSISRDPYVAPGDVLQIAQIFYPSRESDKNRFFNDQAQNLFLGLTLFLIETQHPRCTLGEVFRQGSGYDQPLPKHLKSILEKHPNLSRQCRDAISRALSNPEETFGNIKASFDAPLLLFANPMVDAATSASDFNLANVRREKVSIYFGVAPNRLEAAARLINLFFAQTISLNTGVLPDADKKLAHQCLVLLDEFTAFGRVGIVAKAVSYIAGYNLRLLTIIQSKSQLEGEGLYSKADARNMITNHEVRIIFPPGDDQEAKDASEMLGYYTAKAQSVSSNHSGHFLSVSGNSSGGTNTSDQRRALMMPQELKQMPSSQAIVDKQGMPPVLCEKVRFFDDPVFIDRLKAVSPSLARLGEKLPSRAELDAARISGELSAPIPTLFIASPIESTNDDEQEADVFSNMSEAEIEAAAIALAAKLPDYAALETHHDYKAIVQEQFFNMFFLSEKEVSHARI